MIEVLLAILKWTAAAHNANVGPLAGTTVAAAVMLVALFGIVWLVCDIRARAHQPHCELPSKEAARKYRVRV